MFTQNANKIFAQAIDDYHRYDDVDHQLSNPYAEGTIDHLLYMKNWWIRCSGTWKTLSVIPGSIRSRR